MRLILGNIILLSALIWTFVEDDVVVPPTSLFTGDQRAPAAEPMENTPGEIAAVWTRDAEPAAPAAEPEAEQSAAPLEAGETDAAAAAVDEPQPPPADMPPVELPQATVEAEDVVPAGEPAPQPTAESVEPEGREWELAPVDAGALDAIAASLEQFYLSRQR